LKKINFNSAIDLLKNGQQFQSDKFIETTISFNLGGVGFDLRVPDHKFREDLATLYKGFEGKLKNPIVIKYLPFEMLSAEICELCIEESYRYRNVQLISNASWLDDNEIMVFRWDFRALVNLTARKARALLVNEHPSSFDAVARISGVSVQRKVDRFKVY